MKRTISRAGSHSEADGRRDQEQKRPRIYGQNLLAAPQLGSNSNIIDVGGDVIMQAHAGNRQYNRRNTDTIDRRKLAEWLSSHNFHATHRDTLQRVTPGTGEWVLKLSEFVEWMGKESDTLWGIGAPGAGKTCLSAVVINFLRKNALDSDGKPATVIFIYCQYKEKLTTAQILASLLKQIVEISPEVAQSIHDTLYSECNRADTPPSETLLLKTLKDSVYMFPRLFIVVDGLDELDRSVNQEIVGHLISLQKSLFLTSRPLTLPQEPLSHFWIKAPSADFQKYIQIKLNHLPELEELMDEELISTIAHQIELKADGNFLLVTLRLSVLLSTGITSLQELEDTIQHLPASLDGHYREILNCICNKGTIEKYLAQRTLLLVTHAARVLKVGELSEALAVDLQSTTFNKRRRPVKKALVVACLGLLRINEENQTVHLIHHTAQELLETHNSLLPINPHTQMANLCAAYAYQICPDFAVFKADIGPLNPSEQQFSRLGQFEQKHAFFAYAMRHIGHHTCRAGLTPHNKLPDQVHNLFTAYSPVLLLPTINNKQYIDLGNVVHFAAWHGFQAVLLESLEQSHLLQQGESATSPLFYACLGGHISIIQELSKQKPLQIRLEETLETTCLHVGAEQGQAGIVGLLVGLQTANIGVNARDKQGKTALHVAALYGHTAVVQLLLSCPGVDINAKANSGHTALHYAAYTGHDAVTYLLLNHPGIDVLAKTNQADHNDATGETALGVALRKDHTKVVAVFQKSGYGTKDD